MPTLDVLKQFKTQIDKIGNEAEILARRGEKILDFKDITPPKKTEPQAAAKTPADDGHRRYRFSSQCLY